MHAELECRIDIVGGRRGIYEDDQDVDQERECPVRVGKHSPELPLPMRINLFHRNVGS
jgi:hypothetical protein